MISELWKHSHHSEPSEPNSPSQRGLPLICPHCQSAIAVAQGLCGNRIFDAILLQAARIGTELECDRCGLRFVFYRSSTSSSDHSPLPLSDSRPTVRNSHLAQHIGHPDHPSLASRRLLSMKRVKED